MLVLNEMFKSIQGEGPHQGYTTTFIRVQGCNLRCKWCDTKRAQEGHTDWTPTSVEKILDQLKFWHTKKVCITGGEPLLQLKGLNSLLKFLPPSLSVCIETNGTLPVYKVIRPKHLKELVFVVDVKGPSSGEMGKFDLINLSCSDVVLKFVVGDLNDFEFTERFLLEHIPYHLPILISPAMPPEEFPKAFELATALVINLDYRGFDVKLQLQIHKIIGVE